MTPDSAWHLLLSGSGDSAWNMAMDEALLEALPRLGLPVLRFYGWTQPAASFGYFQKIADIERFTSLRPLVRRPTAGGLVPHDADWTYSLAFPTSNPWYSLTARQSYQRVHQWIQQAFAALGLSTQLAPCACKTGAGQCFVGYEESDLLWRGHKIAGAAQRRRRDGLLIQGSVHPPAMPLDRARWQTAMCEAARSEQGARWVQFQPDTLLQERVQELAIQKYSQDAYNRKR